MCLDDAHITMKSPSPVTLRPASLARQKQSKTRGRLGRDAGARVTHFEADVDALIPRR